MVSVRIVFFTYGVACGAIRSITRQSVDVVVVVVPSKLKNSVHRAKITIEAIITPNTVYNGHLNFSTSPVPYNFAQLD